VGRDLHVGELIFTIIGVFKERVETFGLSDIQAESVLIPFDLVKYYTGVNTLKVLDVQAATPEDVPSVERQVAQVLRSRHPSAAEYNVQTLTAILKAARDISLALTIVLIVIAFIALLISGIGIMNIMLVTVTERTREIGIRKALGASRSDIMMQFLVEACVMTAMGGAIGVLLAYAICGLALATTSIPMHVPVTAVIVAELISAAVGIFFGVYPARKAAMLEPIEALRMEI
jgi:putative ABC transport system permease protein